MSEAAQLENLLALLPPGYILPRDDDSELAKLLSVTAAQLAAIEALSAFIVAALDPRASTLFLEDFETALGLPECGGADLAVGERQLAAVEKYTRRDDLSMPGLIAAAAAIGYAITITELSGDDRHVFQVDVPGALEVTYFRAGISRSGDRLGTFGDDRLRCLLDQRKPAHTNYRLVGV